MSEMVNHPDHYKRLGIEPMDVIEDFNLDCHLGFALKHIARAGQKGPIEVDLQKAAWYLTRRIEWATPPARFPLKGRMAKIVGIQKAWDLPEWRNLAVYNLLCAATVVADEGFLTCLKAARAYVENAIKDECPSPAA